MAYQLTLALRPDTIVSCVHTMWESTYWKPYIVRITGGKQ